MDQILRNTIIESVSKEYKEIFSLDDAQYRQVKSELEALDDETLVKEWLHIKDYYAEVMQELNAVKIGVIKEFEQQEKTENVPDLTPLLS